MIEWNLLPFFMAGFTGGLHCLAMCGGLACVTCQSNKPFLASLSYNMGRASTYMVLGALAGSLGAYFLPFVSFYQTLHLLRWVIGAGLILAGLYVSGLWKGASFVERTGLALWRKLFPLQAKIAPLPSQVKWLLSGALWGLIPCTMLYTALLMAFAAGNSAQGAVSLFAFAMGTMPLMLSASVLSQKTNSRLKSKQFRMMSGGMLVLFGAWICLADALGHEVLVGYIC